MTLPLFPERPAARTVTLIRLAGEIARSVAAISRVAVQGEVYKPTRFGGGRLYFTLRDRAAQVSVMCPPAKAARCRTVAGERVCVVGALSWGNERGQLLLVAEEVTPVGDGAVSAMIAEARRRLEADGVLDRPRRTIPRLPAAIGVVCGSEAAVRKDIESVVAVRFPGYPLRVVETMVSGAGAAAAIIEALEVLAVEPDVGVIILARGGGDATQLLPFSDEELCRAVAGCAVPVVSAIGHEGDRPLCDDVADLRCGTPSLAASAVVPDLAGLVSELAALRSDAVALTGQRLELAARRLGAIDTAGAVLAGARVAESRMARSADSLRFLDPRRRLTEAGERLAKIDHHRPARRVVASGRERLSGVPWRSTLPSRLARAGERLAADARHVDALAPARVLERGYAVVRIPDGPIVRRAAQVAPGQPLDVRLAVGRLGTRVEEVHDD